MGQLLIFFDNFSFYLPAEPNDPGNAANTIFRELCTAYAPAPLGADLSRFNLLLRDLEKSRPDEFSRLFSAARGPVATGRAGDRDETSAAGVFSALHKDAATINSIRYKERLWQARLILKLAEILDRREAEVREGLARVSSVEHQVFSSLGGPGEAAAAELAAMGGPGAPGHGSAAGILQDKTPARTSGPLMGLRLKAWAELYLADSSGRSPLVLVTATPASGFALLDGYENDWRTEPQKLFSLAMPPVHLTGEKNPDQYLAAREAFRAAAKTQLEYFATSLQKAASLPGSSSGNREEPAAAELAEHVSAWEALLQAHYPVAAAAGPKLVFYSMPGVSCSKLFQKMFHLEGPVQADRREHPTTILAILVP